MSIKHIITGGALMAIINGRPYSITKDNPSFETIRMALANGDTYEVTGEYEAYVEELFDAALAVKKFMRDGEITIDAGFIFYRGQEVHGTVVDRILDFKSKGLPFQPLVAFLQRLMANPSKRAVEELYGFIERNKLPITPDGFFLGYKGVTADYKDVHTQTIDNSVGAEPPRMKRNDVDDDWRVACSSGYHVGSQVYATGFGTKTVIVQVDPADVVSVPDEEWKLRTVGYKVVSDYAGDLPEVIALAEQPYAPIGFVKRILNRIFGTAKLEDGWR